ncbi:hypothetical protein JCM16161A_25140 [Vulcanisaeta sp. JCM 16161]|uniref:hypothetical protein n=1 Tax=Vulcanisaeta sp. JCM 16161 TaxID=1295372 RepID=UPI0006D20140|nr:hypothetical protein [Vulcanisaeta sp. JCM 16161]
MQKKIIIVTAEWDYFKEQLSTLCSQLSRAGVDCEVRDYGNPEALRLIVKYGIDNGMIRIPQIYVISDGNVRRIDYEVTSDLKIIIKDLNDYISNE